MVKRLNAEFTLKDCLFGNVEITKNTDPDKHLIQDMKFDLILVHLFLFQILIRVKMPLF